MIEQPVLQSAPSGGWRSATVREVAHPTPRGVKLRLEVADRVQHLPGQHYVIRLRAPDGYTAQRSYSVASAPADPLVEFFVERFDDGEVSTYLADVTEPGDELEVRGPIGGWFVWRADAPASCVGGGSGVVPLVAMLRHARDLGAEDLIRLAVSSPTLDDLPYASELEAHGATIALTRQDVPAGRPKGRLTGDDLAPLVAGVAATWFVCGSAQFAESLTRLIVDGGVPEELVRVERFGPSG